jgi:hypothetical protein
MSAETVDVGKIRLAGTPPTRCSACFCQVPDRQHVDFGAAWDGPTFPGGDEVVGQVVTAIDDLIICEECLRAGAELLGLEDPGDVARHARGTEQENEELREKLGGAMAYIAQLEAAAAARGILEDRLAGGEKEQ